MTVSVLSIEGTDCRLDELGTLADRTGGKVRQDQTELWFYAPNLLMPFYVYTLFILCCFFYL